MSSICSAKATHIFSAKHIRILYIESAKTVNEMTLNGLVKLTTLWTTGPRSSTFISSNNILLSLDLCASSILYLPLNSIAVPLLCWEPKFDIVSPSHCCCFFLLFFFWGGVGGFGGGVFCWICCCCFFCCFFLFFLQSLYLSSKFLKIYIKKR